jgi:hypothetical protein
MPMLASNINNLEISRVPRPRTNPCEQKISVEQFLNSGLTQKVFCELHDLNKATFKNWVFRHKSTLEPKPVNPPSQPAFVPINIKVDHHAYGEKDNHLENDNDDAKPKVQEINNSSDHRLNITCAKLTIQIPVGFDTHYLQQILAITVKL